MTNGVIDAAAAYVDVEGGLSRVRGNKTLYRRMLQLFLDSKEFGEMEERFAAENFKALAETAHGIKGMTGNLALPKLFEISTKLMDELRADSFDIKTYEQYLEILADTRKYVEIEMQKLD